MKLASLFVLICILVSCSSTPPAERRNASAAIACRDFMSAMSDLSKGLLTTPELRTRLQSIQSNVRLAVLDKNARKPPTGFQESSERMLRLATNTDDATAFMAAAAEFRAACGQQQF